MNGAESAPTTLAAMEAHQTEANRSWVVFAFGWPVVCGIAYAAWTMYRPSTVSVDGWTAAYGFVVGAVLGGLLGCAAFVGGTWSLALLDGERTRTVGWLGAVSIFALITASTVGITVLALFALSRDVAAAVGPTVVVVGVSFLASLTYGPLVVRRRASPR